MGILDEMSDEDRARLALILAQPKPPWLTDQTQMNNMMNDAGQPPPNQSIAALAPAPAQPAMPQIQPAAAGNVPSMPRPQLQQGGLPPMMSGAWKAMPMQRPDISALMQQGTSNVQPLIDDFRQNPRGLFGLSQFPRSRR